MAFSGSQNINNYAGINLYTPDFQLISTALASKQQKLDTNRAKLQSYRDQLGLSLDVAKDADQKYIDDRLTKLTEMTNQYADMDLSNDGLTQSLMSNLGQVIDGNVKNAVTSTKILQAEQSEWKEMRTKKPELYSDNNYRFAMQKANNWMNDGTVGTAYNGGGGFIEYVDIDKMVTDKMKDLDKQLRKTSIRSSEAGAVDALETIEEVRRSDVEKAIRSSLTGKYAKQLEINAWSQYDRLPDETLRQSWDDYTSSKVGEMDEELNTYESMLKNATDSDQKAAIRKAISNVKEAKTSWEDSDFDTAVNSFGKQGVYTKLHTDTLLDNYLDMYSEAPHVVKREADDVQKANLDYNLSLEKFSETKRHNQVMEETALLKANKGKTSKDGTGGAGDGWITEAGTNVEVPYEQAKEALATNQEKTALWSRDKVINQFKATGLNDAEANNLLKSKDFVAYLKNGVFTKPFKGEVNGKQRNVQLKAETLNTYREAFVDPPKVKKQAYKTIDAMVEDAHKAIYNGIKTGDAGYEGLPKFNFVVKYDGDTEHFKIVRQPQSHNRYANLIQKKVKGKGLSSAEKKELELYSNIHLLEDPTLRAADKNLVRQKLIGQGLQNFDYKTSRSLIEEIHGKKNKEVIPGTYTAKNYWSAGVRRDRYFSEYTMGDVGSVFDQNKASKLEQAKALLAQAKKEGNTELAANYEFIVKAHEKDLQNKPQMGVDKMLKAGFDNIHRDLESYYMPNLPIYKEARLVHSLDKEKYASVSAMLGFDKSSKNYDIRAIPEINPTTGKPTGNLVFKRQSDVTTKSKETSGVPMEEAPKKLTYAEAKQAGILMVADTDIHEKYDARQPDKARTLNLGNGSNANKDLPTPINMAVEVDLYNRGKQYSDNTVMATQQVVTKFNSGGYNFKVEPDGGAYYFRAYDKSGKPALGGAKVPVAEYLSQSELDMYHKNPDYQVNNYFPALVLEYQRYYAAKETER